MTWKIPLGLRPPRQADPELSVTAKLLVTVASLQAIREIVSNPKKNTNAKTRNGHVTDLIAATLRKIQ